MSILYRLSPAGVNLTKTRSYIYILSLQVTNISRTSFPIAIWLVPVRGVYE